MRSKLTLALLMIGLCSWALACSSGGGNGNEDTSSTADVVSDLGQNDISGIEDTPAAEDTGTAQDAVEDTGPEADVPLEDVPIEEDTVEPSCDPCAPDQVPADPGTCPAVGAEDFCVSGLFVNFADNTPITAKPAIDILLCGDALGMAFGGCHKGCQASLRDDGSFILPGLEFVEKDSLLILVANDLDYSDYITTVSGILTQPGTNMNYEGAKSFMLPTAVFEAWKTKLAGDPTNYADVDTILEKGFFIGRILDDGLSPLAGAKVIQSSGLEVDDTFYFTPTMDGFSDGDVTTASGAFLIVAPPISSYKALLDGYVFGDQMGGSSEGTASVVFFIGAAL